MPNPPAFGPLPGEFALKTYLRGTPISARDGGHHSIDALITLPSVLGCIEKFHLESTQPDFTHLQDGRRLLRLGQRGGGIGGSFDDTQTFQTERQAIADDALFRSRGAECGWTSTIKTWTGNYDRRRSAAAGSRRAHFTRTRSRRARGSCSISSRRATSATATSDAIRPLGTGNVPGHGDTPRFLSAIDGGGRTTHTMTATGGFQETARFTLLRQRNGTFALLTSNGRNFVTAEGGGGLAHGTPQSDNVQTNRTVAQAWEQFKIEDQGTGTYTIQTVSGFYLAVGPGFDTFSTRISFPDEAPSIGYNAKFELLMLGV